MGDSAEGLTALAEFVQESKKGGGALDEAIALFLGWKEYEFEDENGYRESGWHAPDSSLPHSSVPKWTTSLDVAMTLVPEDYDWAVFRTNGGLTVHARCGSREDVFGNTPALALCAAALRARAAVVTPAAP